MRPLSSSFRFAAAAALIAAAAACADAVTQPNERGPSARADLLGATTDAVTGVVDTTASDVLAATLLVCPSAQADTQRLVVGPVGGELDARGASIRFPAGAVPEPTLFEIVVPASQYLEADIHAVGVEHYVFQSPVTVTINYARCPAGAVPDSAALEGAYVDTGSYRVLELMGGVNDRSGHKVVFSTGHLSGYVIAY